MAKFRVIIIGGGPVGLSMAHCLRLAGIDYVLCEQRPTIEDRQGAGLSVLPHISRLFEQFGLYAETEKHGAPIQTTVHLLGEDSKNGWRDNGFGSLEAR
jgi:2-polyprenyl-6-methoxyphenol hydroxylase-like FAD-dependent oxidoreductase